jgi:hypothetical protein
LFDNAQPVSGDIIGVVRAGTSDFFVAEIRHFAIKKSPKQHGQGNLYPHIYLICSSGLPTRNKIPRISTSLFVL